MGYDERYLKAIREKVCTKCIVRTSGGICAAPTYEACAINRFLPEIIDIVLTAAGNNAGATAARLREKVCSVCQHQSPDGRCDLRDDVECGLDRYVPLIRGDPGSETRPMSAMMNDRSTVVAGRSVLARLLLTVAFAAVAFLIAALWMLTGPARAQSKDDCLACHSDASLATERA